MPRAPRWARDMTTDTGTKAHFHCNDVVVTLGVGEPWRIAHAVLEGLPG